MAGRISYLGNIPVNGLVLDVDAGKVDSYPRTGSVWTDLSIYRNGGTLTNGSTFSSENVGGIVFDGSNDYTVFQNTSTIPLWVDGWTNGTGYLLNGVISMTQIYNKEIVASQVLQNHKTTKRRFGL